MALDTRNPKSPWYVVFDHLIPGHGKKVVLTSALLNEMKSDLSQKEFRSILSDLNNYKKKGWEIKKRRLMYWKLRYKRYETKNIEEGLLRLRQAGQVKKIKILPAMRPFI